MVLEGLLLEENGKKEIFIDRLVSLMGVCFCYFLIFVLLVIAAILFPSF